jgi:ketosteroid isomerase-like protein
VTNDEARAFADDWAAAWNELAVERVLSHFDENASFTSPTALAVMGVATVCGKQARSMSERWRTLCQNERARAHSAITPPVHAVPC